jgi:hypothetical protein
MAGIILLKCPTEKLSMPQLQSSKMPQWYKAVLILAAAIPGTWIGAWIGIMHYWFVEYDASIPEGARVFYAIVWGIVGGIAVAVIGLGLAWLPYFVFRGLSKRSQNPPS